MFRGFPGVAQEVWRKSIRVLNPPWISWILIINVNELLWNLMVFHVTYSNSLQIRLRIFLFCPRIPGYQLLVHSTIHVYHHCQNWRGFHCDWNSKCQNSKVRRVLHNLEVSLESESPSIGQPTTLACVSRPQVRDAKFHVPRNPPCCARARPDSTDVFAKRLVQSCSLTRTRPSGPRSNFNWCRSRKNTTEGDRAQRRGIPRSGASHRLETSNSCSVNPLSE